MGLSCELNGPALWYRSAEARISPEITLAIRLMELETRVRAESENAVIAEN
jgi:hypothetical protein